MDMPINHDEMYEDLSQRPFRSLESKPRFTLFGDLLDGARQMIKMTGLLQGEDSAGLYSGSEDEKKWSDDNQNSQPKQKNPYLLRDRIRGLGSYIQDSLEFDNLFANLTPTIAYRTARPTLSEAIEEAYQGRLKKEVIMKARKKLRESFERVLEQV